MIPRCYKIGLDRLEQRALPPRVEDYIAADNVARAIDAYVDS